jgi:hypothetical protein
MSAAQTTAQAKLPQATVYSAPPAAVREPAASMPPCPWQQRACLERAEGFHASVSFTVDSAMNLIAPRAFFPFGWNFFYSGGHEGCFFEVPGVRNFTLRQDTGRAHVYLDLVRTAEGAVVKDPRAEYLEPGDETLKRRMVG